jgi:hypothetical protein
LPFDPPDDDEEDEEEDELLSVAPDAPDTGVVITVPDVEPLVVPEVFDGAPCPDWFRHWGLPPWLFCGANPPSPCIECCPPPGGPIIGG